MIIADLNYLETISKDTSCVEGGLIPRRPPSANALALSNAQAIGFNTQTETVATTGAVAGLFSSSYSGSQSIAVGYVV